MWKHCSKNYTDGIMKCRVCGAQKPTYGFKTTPKTLGESRIEKANGEEKYFESCLLMKDGRTAEDIKKEETQTNETE